MNIGEECLNRWPSILPLVGVNPSHLTGRQGPCPSCGGKDRFRFDNKEGKGTFYCNACGPGDGVKLAMMANGWSFRQAAKEIREVIGDTTLAAARPVLNEETRVEMLRALWRRAKKIDRDDECARYLTNRGLKGPYPSTLRFVRQCEVTGEAVKTMPAMVALVTDDKGKSVNLHRTYLWDGKKANIQSPRRMMPGRVEGAACAIRLGKPTGTMGVAEGVETALSATALTGIPCWATLNTGGLKAFVPPVGVERLVIFADNDAKFGGQAAAFSLAHKLSCLARPIEVEIRLPERPGTDWNDVLIHRA